MRTKAREVAFQIVFASRFGEVERGLKSVLYKKENLTKDDIDYCDKVLSIIEEHETEFAKILDERSVAFPESRLFPADKSILLVALAEILHIEDIPHAVSVNEAANIASKYSSEKSASFVSGILSEVQKS
ncbi:MAG: transcription antitermination factor NusB [Clostridia bacterium]|nr:transcription antitermination factor NusB [Clostridia bacterium]